MEMNLFLIVLSYLFGAIPFGLVLGKIRGVDVRAAGSGNIGATNVNRLLGRKLGALTLGLDALKAVAPMAAASWLLAGRAEVVVVTALCGAAAFLGHLFPVYLGFRGGKGVATALGVFLYLNPLAVLVDVVIFVLAVAASGFVSVGSLAAAAAIPVLVWLLNGGPEQVWLAVFIAVLVWIKHQANIRRLIAGEEKSWRKNSPAKPGSGEKS